MARKTAKTPDEAAPLPPLRRHVDGNVGLYFAAYRLSKLGWNVMPTSRNARGVDLLAYDMSARRYRGIQVKTLSKRDNVRLGGSRDELMGDWWIIVTKVATDNPQCFIMRPSEVRKLAKRANRADPINKERRFLWWLGPNKYDTAKFRDAWERIGRGGPTTLQARRVKRNLP